MRKHTAIEVLFQSVREFLRRTDLVTFLLEVYDSTTVDVGDDSRRACVSVGVSYWHAQDRLICAGRSRRSPFLYFLPLD